jgi:hypothetical protein
MTGLCVLSESKLFISKNGLSNVATALGWSVEDLQLMVVAMRYENNTLKGGFNWDKRASIRSTVRSQLQVSKTPGDLGVTLHGAPEYTEAGTASGKPESTWLWHDLTQYPATTTVQNSCHYHHQQGDWSEFQTIQYS